jgi:hypothetical protein
VWQIALPGTRATPTNYARVHGNIRRMKILTYLHVVVAQAFYRWAMREIDPTHPDVPRIMLRQKELADKASRLFA